jgi:hypothetical protein
MSDTRSHKYDDTGGLTVPSRDLHDFYAHADGYADDGEPLYSGFATQPRETAFGYTTVRKTWYDIPESKIVRNGTLVG